MKFSYLAFITVTSVFQILFGLFFIFQWNNIDISWVIPFIHFSVLNCIALWFYNRQCKILSDLHAYEKKKEQDIREEKKMLFMNLVRGWAIENKDSFHALHVICNNNNVVVFVMCDVSSITMLYSSQLMQDHLNKVFADFNFSFLISTKDDCYCVCNLDVVKDIVKFNKENDSLSLIVGEKIL